MLLFGACANWPRRRVKEDYEWPPLRKVSIPAETGRRCAWCGRNGRAPAPPVCEALPRSSLLTWHAGGTRWGSAVLEAVLPAHDGPTAVVPVETGDVGLTKLDGIEAKRVVVDQLGSCP